MILPAAGEQPWQEISALHFRDEDGGMVAYTGNPATWEAEAGASIGLQSYSRPHREFQASERKREKKEEKRKRKLFMPCDGGEAEAAFL